MIRFEKVTKRYGLQSPALDGVTLHLARGDFAFLTGASGAGKTTLTRLIYGAERPTSGQVSVGGHAIGDLSRRALQVFRRRLGVVFQDCRLLASRDVFENVTFVLRSIGMPGREQKARSLSVLRSVGLTHRMRAHPVELSGGEQQRVAIARAIAADPDVLLADEPTGNLDPALSREIIGLFKKVNDRGTTILVVTHDEDLIRFARRRVLHLDRGKLREGENP
ncbi:MAG: cell division ATP-binding protein FtsE [Acidobacteriota bacterium]